MPPKILALAAQAGLAFVAWWLTRSESDRRTIQAGLWRELEKLAMACAKDASNLAAFAADRYKQTVMV
jgi:hypothetical protein